GAPIPPNTPPEVLTIKADDDWSPFRSRAGFELAEFMFTDTELSLGKIDKLLELWAATLVSVRIMSLSASKFKKKKNFYNPYDFT
ncbi:hypothetical protein BDM02DRAFT_3071338, partial [Thelephora ganbajun]